MQALLRSDWHGRLHWSLPARSLELRPGSGRLLAVIRYFLLRESGARYWASRVHHVCRDVLVPSRLRRSGRRNLQQCVGRANADVPDFVFELPSRLKGPAGAGLGAGLGRGRGPAAGASAIAATQFLRTIVSACGAGSLPGGPGHASSREHVEVKVIDRLAAFFALVDDHSIAVPRMLTTGLCGEAQQRSGIRVGRAREP